VPLEPEPEPEVRVEVEPEPEPEPKRWPDRPRSRLSTASSGRRRVQPAGKAKKKKHKKNKKPDEADLFDEVRIDSSKHAFLVADADGGAGRGP
jgi:hypothetical protein